MDNTREAEKENQQVSSYYSNVQHFLIYLNYALGLSCFRDMQSTTAYAVTLWDILFHLA